MIKIVVTGSIGMGKSTTAKMFVEEGNKHGLFLLYDVDKVVHALYEKGGAAVQPLTEVFPDAIKNDAVDRKALAKLVLGNAEKIKALEAIVHPLTAKTQIDFVQEGIKKEAVALVFDIPLFFETKGDERGLADYIVVVTAPEAIQKERTLARNTMSEEQFLAIKQKQMPSEEKVRRADFVVETEQGLAYAQEQVKKIIGEMINATNRS